jgi:hypothetical protein
MHDLTKCERNYHNMRAELMDLCLWAETQLDGERDRQYIAEHMTAVLDAVLAGAMPPARPF